MLKSFYHTGFIVRDLEQSVRFYTDVLGMNVARRMEREGEFIN
ncbi:MAG: VOC family protein, partial [Chloroflexi bacterium]|nr:VOC family protein [Chloroflexota bacterium]